MDTNDEQHPEQGGGNSEGYSDLHFIENEIVPESGTSEDEYVPESGTGLYFMPELPTEDEQRIKVEKYGYLNPRKADYIPHDYIRQVMLRGTGFEGGFDRVVQIFQNEMEAGKRTALIKRNTDLAGRAGRLTAWGFMDMTHMVLRAYVSSGVMSRAKQKAHCHGAALNRKSEPLY